VVAKSSLTGVSAFIHVASDLSFSTDADKVINGTLTGVRSALAAAASEPSMEHFVYTSSAAAIGWPQLEVEYRITANSWNEESVPLAWSKADNPFKAGHIYSASKVLAEKEVWEFAKKQGSDGIVVNSVVPNMNWGPILVPGKGKPSSGGLIPDLYQKGLEGTGMFRDFPPRESR
jgi:nucleoside-diphosphate-sugar epimerase